MQDLAFQARIGEPHARTVDIVTEALKAEGFGVLTRIDLDAAFKEKLDVDFRPYTILGACNPHLAHRAVSSHPEVGLLLPCNVTVEEDPAGGCTVRITDPMTLLSMGGAAEGDIAEIARDARERLSRVAAELGG